MHKDIQQGNMYWLQSTGSEHPHPHVVIQDTILNRSRIKTVVVCSLSSNKKRFNEPGNILLELGEGNLTKQSAIIVSKISTVDKSDLGEYIGSLNSERITQIYAGLRFLQLSYFKQNNEPIQRYRFIPGSWYHSS